jgi:hypothetical protein
LIVLKIAYAVGVVLAVVLPIRAEEKESTPSKVFEKRILPIFRSPNPSSCTQCHLAGVDLKNYILPSHEKTFLSLRDLGLIDLDSPEKSKILKLITMREEDRKGAALIHEKRRQAEYDAFKAWIVACAGDARLRAAPKLPTAERAAPPRPVEVIRHARKDRLLESFEKTIWAMRFRCIGCHMPGQPDHAKHLEEYGERVSWLKREGAEATMMYILQSRLIDRKYPEESKLLLKPAMLIKHGGGKKMLVGDIGYKAYRQWLEDAASILGDRYRKAGDLPARDDGPSAFGTDIWLKLADTPAAWGDRLLRVQLYAWDKDAGAWEREPIAVSDRGVWGKGRLWQHNLVLLATKGSPREKAWKKDGPSLPAGKYRLEVHVDAEDRLARDWLATLGKDDFAGATEVTSRWSAGYGRMTVVPAARVTK